MSSWLKFGLIGLLIVLLAGGIYGYQRFVPLINTGTGLVAHQMCACVFVSHRDLAVCLDERWPDMQSIPAERIEFDGKPGIQATSFIATRTATFESGFGCTLQD
jgi:hypothetical protein